jgi:hypothetical protein
MERLIRPSGRPHAVQILASPTILRHACCQMPRESTKGRETATSSTDQQRHEQLLEALGQLKSVIEEQLAAIHDRLEHIAEVVRENTEEIGVLRDAIDEEKEVMEWAAQNDKRIFQLTSMPVDPTAEDWAARMNMLTPSDLPPELQTADPHATSAAYEQDSSAQPQTEQKQLWS